MMNANGDSVQGDIRPIVTTASRNRKSGHPDRARKVVLRSPAV